MKILMTGGTGLVGKAFIERYRLHEYTVVTRSIERGRRVLPEPTQFIDSLASLSDLDEFDAVINLAGEPIMDKRWTSKQKQSICQSRWGMTRRLAELFASSHTPPSVFLSGSAIGVYGNRGELTLSEASPVVESDFPSKVCVQWEEIAKAAKPYTRVVHLRTGVVLDRKGGALAKMLPAYRFGLGGRLGNGRQYMSWIHWQDQIAAMEFLLTARNVSGPVNLVAPDPVTNHEFSQSLAKVLCRPALIPVPAIALRSMLGESSCLVLDSQKVMPRKLLESGFHFSYPGLHSAFTDLLVS